jgi:DNA-binding response OmpR family regulator
VARARKLIAVVEDDADIARLIQRTLGEFGFAVERYGRGADLLRKVGNLAPDACIVDLGLPDMDGLEVLRKLIEHDLPVIVLTGRGGVADRVLGLELGADDYLAKPFEPRELVARINAVLRRTARRAGAAPMVARFAGWTFDPEAMALTAPDGEAVRLSRAEAQLLELFVGAPNRILTRDHLMHVRGTAGQAFDRSIDVRISRLRQKLRDDPQNPHLIRTIYGAGYLFATAVEWQKRG